MRVKLALTVVLATGLALGTQVACGPTGPDDDNDNQTHNNNNQVGPCQDGTTQCTALSEYQVCQNGEWVTQMTCLDPNPYCTPDVGCTPCMPGVNTCDANNNIVECTAQGQPGAVVQACEAGQECAEGVCTSPCLVAEQTNSYIGCDYWPTPTANSQLDPEFDTNFGVVVHNANEQAAAVTIERGGSVVDEQIVQAGELYTFELSYVQDLKLAAGSEASTKVAGGAYHLTSTLPVTVYQFNPLDYDKNGVFSHTNDASLLLPTHVLSTNYIIMARQTFGVDNTGFGMFSFIPGYFAVVGTENNTSVTVNYTANTQGGGSVGAETPGSSQTYTLNAGEVLQVVSGIPTSCTGTQSSDDCNGQGGSCSYCDMGDAYDLTGTVISSDKKVAVFSGHVCDFVPYNYWACDHLEEQMLPLETWGKEFIVGRTEPQHASGYPEEPNVIRIVSGDDGNQITFNPPQALGATINLNQGDWVEFEATEDFHVSSSHAMMIGQFLVGQNYYTDSLDYHGDPAYSVMVPTEQFRNQYTFLAPSTITYNYVNITKKVIEGSAPVYLDGEPVSESAFSTPVGGTEWGVARVEITGTHHTIESNQPFGIVVYGFASYTSYSYPGGLDLKFINPVD